MILEKYHKIKPLAQQLGCSVYAAQQQMALNFELVVSDQPQVIQNKHPWCSTAAYATAGYLQHKPGSFLTMNFKLDYISAQITKKDSLNYTLFKSCCHSQSLSFTLHKHALDNSRQVLSHQAFIRESRSSHHAFIRQ